MQRNNSAKGKNNNAAIDTAEVDLAVYSAVESVFVSGAFCAKAITDALKTLKIDRARAFVTSAFYGVLDNNIRLEKIISSLCEKHPDPRSESVLKIGLYYIRYADMPDYAAVNRTVELARRVNGVYGGFINAVLKKSINFVPTFNGLLEKFSYEHGTPEWLCKKLIVDYSETRAASILDAKLPDGTHIRPVKGRMTWEKFAEIAEKNKCETTEFGCFASRRAQNKFPTGAVTVQSLASIRAVRAYITGISCGKVLDLCAAPGGKSVYISESGDFDVTACDVYPHKTELIRGMANALGANISVMLNDATKLNERFIDAYDLVIADCPCSGTGTLKSRPDILLKRKPSDIDELTQLQTEILQNAASYVKPSGVLCYSTCSVLKAENERITLGFLANHPEYTLIDETKFLPDRDGCDGFYIARYKRSEQ